MRKVLGRKKEAERKLKECEIVVGKMGHQMRKMVKGIERKARRKRNLERSELAPVTGS